MSSYLCTLIVFHPQHSLHDKNDAKRIYETHALHISYRYRRILNRFPCVCCANFNCCYWDIVLKEGDYGTITIAITLSKVSPRKMEQERKGRKRERADEETRKILQWSAHQYQRRIKVKYNRVK